MPLIAKRKGEVLTTESKRHKTDSRAPGPSKKSYESLQRIGYVQDEWHTLVRIVPSSVEELRKVAAKYVGSFLNGKGGILVFGVSRTGFVYGDTINRKEEDNLRLTIDETFKKFKPMVRPDMYRITFTSVVGGGSRDDLQVIEIRVSSGDRNELYQDEFHEVFLRRDSDAYGPLTPHEIKMHTLKQCREKLIAEKCFVNILEDHKGGNSAVEVGDKGTERNNNKENSQARQQKVDNESEKERENTTPVIKCPNGGEHEDGLNKKTAIDLDRCDKVSGDSVPHRAKASCLSESASTTSSSSLKVAPTPAQVTTSSALKVAPTPAQVTTSSSALKVAPTPAQVTTSSALKVAPTMVTSSLKVIPTATSDRGLAIGHYADKSRVPLVKAVATCDTDKENICPTKSGCLAITVAATNPYSVHMVTPSSYQQPVVHQALVQKQPAVTQVVPWLHQQPGNSNMMAQRVAMPMGRPQLHNYTIHRSVTMGQHHGMGTLNIVTRIPAPQPLPYTLAAPATFYPSLRPPSYYH